MICSQNVINAYNFIPVIKIKILQHLEEYNNKKGF